MNSEVATLVTADDIQHVSGLGITLAFYSVMPGLERDLFQATQPKDSPLSRRYWTLGRSDVLITEPLRDVADFVSPRFPRGATQIHSVPCFQWEKRGRRSIGEVLDQPVLGVCFAKLRPDLLEQYGIRAERRAARFIEDSLGKNYPDVKLDCLGSLGWTEIVMLVGGVEIQTVFDAVGLIRGVTDADIFPEELRGKRRGTAPSVFLTTFTVPAVNFGVIERRRSLYAISTNIGKAVARVTLSCAPGAEHKLAKLLDSCGFSEDKFNTTFMLGRGDLVVQTRKTVAFGALVASLLNFRTKSRPQLGAAVFATDAVVSRDKLPGSPRLAYTPPIGARRLEPPPNLDVLEPFKRGGSAFHRFDVYSSLARMIKLDVSCKNSRLLQGAFVDMKGFVPRVLVDIHKWTEGYESIVPSDATRTMHANLFIQKLQNAAELFAFGFSERHVGTYEALYENIDPPKAYPGGVQRILQAAATIPQYLSEPFRHSWAGFVVFGRSPWCQREEFGVMSLPLSELLRPEGWWQLFHEVGHEVAESVDLPGDEDVVRFVEAIFGPPTEADFHHIREFVTELFADLFDYYYGFRGDLDNYISTVWRFLDRYLLQTGTDPARFVLRHTFVVLIRDKKDLCEYEHQDVIEAVRSLKARLSEMGLRSEAAQVDEERIVRAAMVLQRVMPVICDRLWLGRRPRDRKGAPDPTNRHLQATKEGAVDPLEDRASFDPVAFLVGLAQHQAIPGSREDQFKRSVAAILTLWSWYHLKLGEERGSQMIRGR